MEHVELWYDLATTTKEIALILEDDIIFVPHFRTKLNCAIAEVLGNSHVHSTFPPMLVIGGCFNFHDERFQYTDPHAIPLLSIHKQNATRCSHAYFLSSDSAKTLIQEIKRVKNHFSGADIFLRQLFARSTTLFSIWIDPPIAYQRNQIFDLDQLRVFVNKSY